MNNYQQELKNYLMTEIEVMQQIDIEAINDAMNLLWDTFEKEGNIYIFGNGGSASTASHFQNDFNKGISEYTEKKFRFNCLSDNISTLTAIANDISYEAVYSEQLKGRLKTGDIVIAISGSGNSKNIIRAVEYAKTEKIPVIGISGYNGGELKKLSDISLHVPIDDMQIVEDVHMMFDHMMMSVFYKRVKREK